QVWKHEREEYGGKPRALGTFHWTKVIFSRLACVVSKKNVSSFGGAFRGPPEAGRDRALLGVVGRKLLKVIVHPITALLIGKPATFVAEHWERAHRAYELRDFSPANYRQPMLTAVACGPYCSTIGQSRPRTRATLHSRHVQSLSENISEDYKVFGA